MNKHKDVNKIHDYARSESKSERYVRPYYTTSEH